MNLGRNRQRARARYQAGAAISPGVPITFSLSPTVTYDVFTETFDAPVLTGTDPDTGHVYVIATPGRTIVSSTPTYATSAPGTWLFDGPTSTQSVTFQDVADTVTLAAHGLVGGQKIKFLTVVTTTGITAGPDYYVVSAPAPTLNTFQVENTPGSGILPLTNNGSGTMQRYGATTRQRNGKQINPGNSAAIYGGTGSTATNNGGATPEVAFPQAFDSVDSVDAVLGSTLQNFSLTTPTGGTDMRPAYPISIASPLSIVSTVSKTTGLELTGRPTLLDMGVVTVVATPPVIGSFRPAPSATSKAVLATKAQMNLSFLPTTISKTGVPGAPANDAALIAEADKYKTLYQSFYTNNLFTRSIAAENTQNGFSYGRDIAEMLGDSLQFLCLDYGAAAKLELAYWITQIGLDYYERTNEGGSWPGGTTSAGAGCHAQQPFVVFAALALAGSPVGAALATVAGGTKFATTRQIFNVTQDEIDIPRSVQSPLNTIYYPYMKTSPEWTSKWVTYGGGGGPGAGSSLQTRYRAIVNCSSFGIFNAFALMTGGLAMLNDAAWGEYYYRLRNWVPSLDFGGDNVTATTLHFSDNILPARAPYSTATPVLQGVYGQGNWVWMNYDRLLDVGSLANYPTTANFDVRVNGGGAAAPTTVIGPLNTHGSIITAATGNVNQVVTMASVAGILPGHRVIGATFPADAMVISISGNDVTVSRQPTANIPASTALTFSPVVIHGYNMGVRLDTALVEGDTLTAAYSGTTARTIANTAVPTFTATTGTNETLALPPPATVKEMVANDLDWANVQGRMATGTQLDNLTAWNRFIIGVRLKPVTDIVINNNILGNSTMGTATMRWYSSGEGPSAAIRVFVRSGTIRPVAAWASSGAEAGVQSTHWITIDCLENVSALAAYQYARDATLQTLTGSTLMTGSGSAKTFADMFPNFFSVWGGTSAANTMRTGIQEVFMHGFNGAAPVLSGAVFSNSQDWGGNGENILGFAPQYYWAMRETDCNNGVVINRGTAGQSAALYIQSSINLEIYEPFRAI